MKATIGIGVAASLVTFTLLTLLIHSVTTVPVASGAPST